MQLYQQTVHDFMITPEIEAVILDRADYSRATTAVASVDEALESKLAAGKLLTGADLEALRVHAEAQSTAQTEAVTFLSLIHI